MRKVSKAVAKMGYSSYTEMYDAILAENPKIMLGHTVYYNYMTNDGQHLSYKIAVKTLLANCWLELQENRLSADDTFTLMAEIEKNQGLMQPNVPVRKLQTLLLSTQIQSR